MRRGDELTLKQRQNLLNDLESGNYQSFKQLAKKHRIDIGNVNKLAKGLGIHGCVNKPEKINVVHVVPPNTIVQKAVVVTQPQQRKKRSNLTQEFRLEIAEFVEGLINSKSQICKADIMNKYDISYSSLQRILKEFDIKIPAELITSLTAEQRGEKMSKKEESKVSSEKKKATKKSSATKKDSSTVIKEIDVTACQFAPTAIVVEEPKKVEEKKEEEVIIKEDVHETPSISPIESNQTLVKRGNIDLLKINDDDSVIRAGLVGKRHDLPTELCIFKELIDSNTMFNFKKIEQTIIDFINEWIPFTKDENGNMIASKKLEVYVTGLAVANITLVKVCSEMKVNLTMYHFNTDTGVYNAQVVFDKFDMIKMSNNEIFKFFRSDKRYDGLYCYNCELKDFVKGCTFYLIRKVHYPNPYSQNPNKVENIIVTNSSDIWPVFGQLNEEFIKSGKEDPGKTTISAMSIDASGYIRFGDCIAFYNNGIKNIKKKEDNN